MRVRTRRLPGRFKGHASGGGNHGKSAEYEIDEGASARPTPSLAPCPWLLRPDPDDLRKGEKGQERSQQRQEVPP
jgi:hypothetical protein